MKSQFPGGVDLGGHLSIIPGGSHSTVVLMGDVVLKVVADKKRPMNEETARGFAEAMIRYDELLQRAGLHTPTPIEVEVVRNVDTGIWTIVQRAPFAGRDLAVLLREEKPEAVEASVAQLIAVLRSPLHAVFRGNELYVGIDPKPANFTRDWLGVLSFVDLFPPRYRDDDGQVYVEYPEPTTAAGQEVAYFRHFDRRGILLVLLSQLSRLRPELRAFFKRKVWAFADEFYLGDWFRDSVVEKFLAADEASRCRIILGLTAKHLYDMREIACELVAASGGFYTRDDLDRIFHISHFNDGLHVNTVRRIKLVLMKMMQRLPIDLRTER